jgi:DNA-binding response OmpR family regulator
MSAKIMLVEDDTNLSDIYRARLEAEGYQIVSAPDGEDALALAVKEHPDLIISDVMMPKISGFDMLDILRSTNGIKDTRVIMMTALSQAEDQARAKKLGADRYLVKSQVTLEDVVKAVHEVLGDEADETTSPVPAAPSEPAMSSQPDPSAAITVPPVAADEPAQTMATPPTTLESVPDLPPAEPERETQILTVDSDQTAEPSTPVVSPELSVPSPSIETIPDAAVQAAENFVTTPEPVATEPQVEAESAPSSPTAPAEVSPPPSLSAPVATTINVTDDPGTSLPEPQLIDLPTTAFPPAATGIVAPTASPPQSNPLQSTDGEESIVMNQIQNFVDDQEAASAKAKFDIKAPSQQTVPTEEPSPILKSPSAPELKEPPQPDPDFTPSGAQKSSPSGDTPPAPVVTDNDFMAIANKKVIVPLTDPSSQKTDLNELLAKENAAATQQDYVDQPSVTPDQQPIPNQSSADPTNISL